MHQSKFLESWLQCCSFDKGICQIYESQAVCLLQQEFMGLRNIDFAIQGCSSHPTWQYLLNRVYGHKWLQDTVPKAAPKEQRQDTKSKQAPTSTKQNGPIVSLSLLSCCPRDFEAGTFSESSISSHFPHLVSKRGKSSRICKLRAKISTICSSQFQLHICCIVQWILHWLWVLRTHWYNFSILCIWPRSLLCAESKRVCRIFGRNSRIGWSWRAFQICGSCEFDWRRNRIQCFPHKTYLWEPYCASIWLHQHSCRANSGKCFSRAWPQRQCKSLPSDKFLN